MKSKATPAFWLKYGALPADVKERAREAYRRFQANPAHPGLRFKKIHPAEPIYAVRITRDFRALGLLEAELITWFWIGSHDEYDRLIARL